jgi:hypothetical protein
MILCALCVSVVNSPKHEDTGDKLREFIAEVSTHRHHAS